MTFVVQGMPSIIWALNTVDISGPSPSPKNDDIMTMVVKHDHPPFLTFTHTCLVFYLQPMYRCFRGHFDFLSPSKMI